MDALPTCISVHPAHAWLSMTARKKVLDSPRVGVTNRQEFCKAQRNQESCTITTRLTPLGKSLSLNLGLESYSDTPISHSTTIQSRSSHINERNFSQTCPQANLMQTISDSSQKILEYVKPTIKTNHHIHIKRLKMVIPKFLDINVHSSINTLQPKFGNYSNVHQLMNE